eukprot:4091999-Pyramimonas_sp.AAC.1
MYPVVRPELTPFRCPLLMGCLSLVALSAATYRRDAGDADPSGRKLLPGCGRSSWPRALATCTQMQRQQWPPLSLHQRKGRRQQRRNRRQEKAELSLAMSCSLTMMC